MKKENGMNPSISGDVPTRKRSQRFAGVVLICIAFLSIVLDATDLSASPNLCSYLLLAALAVAAWAVHRTEGGLTSLIGLLFLSTAVFNAAEPMYVSLTGDTSIYSMSFGSTVEPTGEALFHLLTFWTVGIASAFGGYFLFFTASVENRNPLDHNARSFCKQAFMLAFLIAATLIPVMAGRRLAAFASGGYAALYLAQAQYSFDPTRLLDFLCPLLYALSVLISEKRYSRLMLTAVLSYALTGLAVGHRLEAGTWFFVMLWHFSTIRRKPLKLASLTLVLVLAAIAFQTIDTLRGGDATDKFILIQYFIGQGITFLLPALSWTLPSPPVHSILGSLFPLGGLYHVLGIGTAADANIGAFVCSQSDPLLFDSGYGLGSSWCIEIFYLCGGVMLLYAVACGFLGFLLRKWEECSARSNVALFFLCACLSSLVSLPRGSLSTISSQVVYNTALIILIFVMSCAPNICRLNDTEEEIIYGAH
jgi:O-antigen polysaccharide polymerase Wzy